ncbi:AVL9/DENND6 domain [Lasallia pustulata]|uniref:AVL9/DENND6 domain n=1 Tax=Lasallia pustulata TaxID=136370 RepID=A0A1W5D3X5_9LECA|nr:AVL9/DENND6 domain [Lasallia pustulata]
MPGLTAHLEDCAHPDLDAAPSSANDQDNDKRLNTTSRADLLEHMGLPLRIFGKGAVFMPYAPLQHLDLLAAYETKSYVVGSTNSLLLQQKERYADLLVNLDEQNSVTILSTRRDLG